MLRYIKKLISLAIKSQPLPLDPDAVYAKATTCSGRRSGGCCFSSIKVPFVLFFISLTLRLFLFYGFLNTHDRHRVYFDSDQYQTIAENVVKGNGFALKDQTPQAYRLPGYSLFLAAVYNFCGIDEQRAMLVQIVASSFIPCCIYWLSLTFFPAAPTAALAAGLMSSLNIGFILYSGMLATESLFVLFFLFFLIQFYTVLFDQFRWYQLVTAGISLGIASLIRPVGVPLLAVACGLMVLRWGLSVASLQRISLLSCSWICAVAPWLIRNYLLMGTFFFHTLPGLHFLQYTATKIVMRTDSLTYVQARARLLAEWQKAINKQEETEHKALNEIQRCVIGERIAFSYVHHAPQLFFYNSGLEMVKTCCSLYSAQMIFADTQEWTEYKTGVGTLWDKIQRYLFPTVTTWWLVPLTQIEILFHCFLLVSCLMFLITAWWDGYRRRILLYTLPFVVILVGLTCAYGCARLRLPIEPFLMAYTAWFWLQLGIDN